ncbi:head-tail connector protein [Candidatus Pacearchaeota archaeon]|jgi:hypothetical protein|nr:head-tail connector protein [Candidatus Pacearchaeota archaeon]
MIVKTPPQDEPLEIEEAKTHLRIDSTDEDEYIQTLIISAREYCENFQNRAYITQTLELWLDEWPEYFALPRPPLSIPSVTAGAFVSGTVYRILTVGTTDFTLIGAAANTVGTIFTATGVGAGTGTATISGVIKYYGTDDTEYFVSGADYFVDSKSEPGRIVLAYGKSWPSTTLRPVNGICVTYVAGYGYSDEVPQAVKQAMKLLIGHWYENRETTIAMNVGAGEADVKKIPYAVESLLWMNRVF